MNGIQRLNYSSNAIEDLEEAARQCRDSTPETARTMHRITQRLAKAQKFLLPNRCELLDPDAINEGNLDMLKLPYPVTALEVPYELDDERATVNRVGDLDLMPSNRRIALCFDETSWDLTPPGLTENNEKWPGIYVVPIFFQNHIKKWTLGIGGAFLPSNYAAPEKETEASRRFEADAREAGLTGKNSLKFRSEPFVLCPEIFRRSVELSGRDKTTRSIINDARDEIHFLIQMCSVINCENVKLDAVEPSATLNRKRKRKGKRPLFSYHILQIGHDSRETNAGEGTHSSPRMHLRRGHIRQYRPGRFTWVRPSMINIRSTDGVVLKDYRVFLDKPAAD